MFLLYISYSVQDNYAAVKSTTLGESWVNMS